MKIDFGQELKTIEGDTLKRAKQEGEGIIQIPATLKWACVEALLSTKGAADKLTGEEKAKRYDLALKIQESEGPLELGVDDVSLAKKLCDENFAPLIVGQTRKLLDAKSD